MDSQYQYPNTLGLVSHGGHLTICGETNGVVMSLVCQKGKLAYLTYNTSVT